MKKSLLALTVISGVFPTVSMAADVEAGVVKNVVKIDSSSSLALNAPASRPDIELNSLSDDIIAQARSAATGVQYFEIGIVYSTNYGQEELLDNQTSTGNHGGIQLQIFLWQYGYGNPTNATMNGISKPYGYSEYRCGTDMHPCLAGETVTGWVYGYDFSGQESGQFNVGTNSTASPFGYWSDSVYIN